MAIASSEIEPLERSVDSLENVLAEASASSAVRVDDFVDRIRSHQRAIADAALDMALHTPDGVNDTLLKAMLVASAEIEKALRTPFEDSTEWLLDLDMARQRLESVVRQLGRRIENLGFEVDSKSAIRVIDERLGQALTREQLARILGVSSRGLASWLSGSPVKRGTKRVVLVAVIVRALENSHTPIGISMWLDSPKAQIGCTPLELMVRDFPRAWDLLPRLARGEHV